MMDKASLLRVLWGLADHPDPEVAHGQADSALLEYINDPEVDEAYSEISKWYA